MQNKWLDAGEVGSIVVVNSRGFLPVNEKNNVHINRHYAYDERSELSRKTEVLFYKRSWGTGTEKE